MSKSRSSWSPEPAPDLDRGQGVLCAEAQPDGVPCDEIRPECAGCERAQRDPAPQDGKRR